MLTLIYPIISHGGRPGGARCTSNSAPVCGRRNPKKNFALEPRTRRSPQNAAGPPLEAQGRGARGCREQALAHDARAREPRQHPRAAPRLRGQGP